MLSAGLRGWGITAPFGCRGNMELGGGIYFLTQIPSNLSSIYVHLPQQYFLTPIPSYMSSIYIHLPQQYFLTHAPSNLTSIYVHLPQQYFLTLIPSDMSSKYVHLPQQYFLTQIPSKGLSGIYVRSPLFWAVDVRFTRCALELVWECFLDQNFALNLNLKEFLTSWPPLIIKIWKNLYLCCFQSNRSLTAPLNLCLIHSRFFSQVAT